MVGSLTHNNIYAMNGDEVKLLRDEEWCVRGLRVKWRVREYAS